MSPIRRWDAPLRFAIPALVVTAAVAAGLAMLAWTLVAPGIREGYGRGAIDLVLPVTQSALAGDTTGPLTVETTALLDARLRPLIDADGLRRVTIWSQDGARLYSLALAAADVPERAPAAGRAPRVRRQGDDLVAAVAADAVTVEVATAYGPAGAALDRASWLLTAIIGGAALFLYVALLAVVWKTGRSMTRDYRRLSYLYQSGRRFASSPDSDGVLDHLCRDVAAVSRARFALAVLIDEKREVEMVLRASYDRQQQVSVRHERPLEEWMLRRAAVSRASLTVHEPACPFRQALGDCGSGPTICLFVPMILRDRATGIVVAIRDAKEGEFGAEEVSFVEELANQAAMSIEQAALFGKVRSYATELEVSYANTLKALMAALDAKDENTEGHSERVAALTLALGRDLGLPESRMTDLERGALLHDVGKIGVPDGILQKPASLTRREWEAMQRHPLLAALMVSGVGFLEGAVPILLYHHERFDGTGYPFGLFRDQIPLEARVFAVIDAYDAMTSDRPYRKALGHQQAMAEIRANAGTQFDPSVVAAFERVIAARDVRSRAAA